MVKQLLGDCLSSRKPTMPCRYEAARCELLELLLSPPLSKEGKLPGAEASRFRLPVTLA